MERVGDKWEARKRKRGGIRKWEKHLTTSKGKLGGGREKLAREQEKVGSKQEKLAGRRGKLGGRRRKLGGERCRSGFSTSSEMGQRGIYITTSA